MEDYKPNSNRFKEEQKTKLVKAPEKKIEKIVTGKVVTKKKSALSKFTDEFISEDAKNVKSYVFGEVLIPAIKKAVLDIVTDGINMILYGDAGRGGRRSNADKVSYRNYYDRGYSSNTRDTRPSTTKYSYDDVVLNSRGEAQEVLMRMEEIIDVYGVVSVADFYEMVGVPGDYTDNKYGWVNLNSADVVRVRDGYLIKLPRAAVID